jgi:Asp-tRNA(Asn)/Glu-tRNA(Gln) amidotransferase A subunit family amidase
VAVGYALCAGVDAADPMTVKQPPLELGCLDKSDLSGVRIGIDRAWFEDADGEIVGVCREAIDVLRSAGAEVREVAIAGLEAARLAHAVTILSEMRAAMESSYAEHRTEFAHATRLGLVLGGELTATDYVRAQRVRREAMAEWARVLGEVDVVVTPTTACLSPVFGPGTERFGASDLGLTTELMRFVFPSNLCGHPAVSVPAGYAEGGLPVGLQLIGRHWEEHLLLWMASVVEDAGERRRPGVLFDVLGESRQEREEKE